jgi:RNA polymerase sigma-70 factor (ECF subfamily)
MSRMDPSDEELVRRYRTGDAAAFDTLVSRHARGALRFAAHLLRDRHEAEDVAQESFLKLLVAARNGGWDPDRGRFGAFFYRIVRNAALDRLRSRRSDAPLDETVPAPAASAAERGAERGEARVRLRDLLEGLPENERAALVLRELEGLSYSDIADVLCSSLEQVKIWIYRARRRIEHHEL